MKEFNFVWMRRWMLLEYLIEVYKLKSIIEVGVFNGDIGKRILGEEKIKLDRYIMIDKRINCKFLEKLYPNVRMIEDLSSSAAKLVENNSVDLVFVDGDHSYEGCKADMVDYTPKIKAGGWMVIHDYHRGGGGAFPGIRDAVHELWGEDFYYIPDESVNGARGIVFKRF
jgi:predicted O-methyltransferase YrrM